MFNRESLTEEDAYNIALKELRENSAVQGIWAKAMAFSEGDEKKSASNYLKFRAEQLLQRERQAEPSSTGASTAVVVFSPHGRITRGLFATIVGCATFIIILCTVIIESTSSRNGGLAITLCFPFFAASAWAFVAAHIKRARDSGVSPFFVLIYLIPWIGWLFLLYFLCKPTCKEKPKSPFPSIAKSPTKAVLRSGWSIFFGANLTISIVVDLVELVASSNFTFPNGRPFSLLMGGSAIIGWLFIALVFVVPAILLREFREAPIGKWSASAWCFVLWCTWVFVHEMQEPGSVHRANFTMIGGMILCWRLLTWECNRVSVGSSPSKTYFFRRTATSIIEGPGSLSQIRAFLMRNGGLKGVVYAENTGSPPESIADGSWNLIDPKLK
jgi:uncharacterized membrane protein YhaH (DUF805 family)